MTVSSGNNQDQDALSRTGETVRESKSRGGRNQSKARNPTRQARNSPVTPGGASWLQVKADWQSGAFSERGLADSYGIPIASLHDRLTRECWGPRPMTHAVHAALPGLVNAIPNERGNPDKQTIEAITAQIEGRPVDGEAVFKERADSSAQRKAFVLRGHRELADRYQRLASVGMQLLSDYADGKLLRAYVRTTDPEGKEMFVPFHLLSKQHGLMDGIDKVGSILGRAIQLQRLAHGLEEVDGDGNLKKNSSGQTNPYSQLTDDELRAKHTELLAVLQAPSRTTPVPSVLAAMRA